MKTTRKRTKRRTKTKKQNLKRTKSSSRSRNGARRLDVEPRMARTLVMVLSALATVSQ